MSTFTQKFCSVGLTLLFVGVINLYACITQCAASARATSTPTPDAVKDVHTCCQDEPQAPANTPAKHSNDADCPHCASMSVEKSAPVRADVIDVSSQFLTLLPPLPRVLLTTVSGHTLPRPSPGDGPPLVVLRDLVHSSCQLTV